MIRAAKFSDIPQMHKLLVASHERSKYAGRCEVSDKAAEQLLTGAVASQNQNGPGACHIEVVERDGKIVGFMAGTLTRIYNIGTKLSASDVFLVNDSKRLRDTLSLIDNYISWAKSNPKVIQIGLSWSDGLPNAKDIASIYRRKGARLVGEQFEITADLDLAEQEEAA